MKILWVGDSPTVSTGFSLCTRKACEKLQAVGHQVTVLGLNYFGDPHDFPFPIYPCINPILRTRYPMGIDRLPMLMRDLKPDVVVILQDPWNMADYLDAIDQYGKKIGKYLRESCKVVGWLAVDAENVYSADFAHVEPVADDENGRDHLGQLGQLGRKGLDHAIVWTDFAADQIRRGGYNGPISVCPLGVDIDNFPVAESTIPSRRRLKELGALPASISDDSFIVGSVGRNQYRKRIDLALSVFSRWVKEYATDNDNAYLLIYGGATGDSFADVRSLIRYFGLGGKVITVDPSPGMGLPYSEMHHVYSAMNLLLSTSQGEGWWLPGLEAMACGTATMAADWSGLGRKGGWPEEGTMVRVPCSSTALTAPFGYGSQLYTVGGVIDEGKAATALEVYYRNPDLLETVGRNGRRLAEKLTWDNATDRLCRLLEGIAA